MTETEEKLAQLTQELLPLCSIAAKPTIIKIEELFLEQMKLNSCLLHEAEEATHRKQSFIEWLETQMDGELDELISVSRVITKAKEML